MFWFGFVVCGFIIGPIFFVIGLAFGRALAENEALEAKLELYREAMDDETETIYDPTNDAWRNN